MKKENAHPYKAEMSATDIGLNPSISAFLRPRQKRVLTALLRNTNNGISRELIDRIARASNGPEVIRQIRTQFGLCKHQHLVCERIHSIDSDGFPCSPGRYRLTPEGIEHLKSIGVTLSTLEG